MIERSASRRQVILEGLRQHPVANEILPQRLERMADVLSQRLCSLTVVLENLFDSHNTSAVIRSAEGLGLFETHVVESLHRFRKAKKITHGADRWLEVRRHSDLTSCLQVLRAQNFTLACADVGPGCVPLEEVPVEEPLAVVLGSEKAGLSRAARRAADVRFTVPMLGFTESFNVSVSAAVALYSLQRRRRSLLGELGDLPIDRAIETGQSWIESTRERRTRAGR